MIILVPLPTYNPITDQINGFTVGLVPIDLMSIKNIEEEENGYATIHYKMSDSLKTAMSFTSLLAILDKQGVVDFTELQSCMKVSKNLKAYIDELKRLDELPNQQ